MILEALFSSPFRNLNNPSIGLAEALDASTYGTRSSAGITVTTERALGFHPFYRGVDLLSSYVGKLPVHINRKVNGGHERDIKHPNYRHLLYRPSPEMNSLTLKKTAELHRLTEGNGYIYCRRKGGGQIEEFVLLDPKLTWPMRANGTLYYMTRQTDGDPRIIKREDVIHIKGLGFDGLLGYPLTHVGKDSIGAGIAVIEFGARFFRNNAVPGAVMEVPGNMPPEAQAATVAAWNRLHASSSEQHRLGIVANGAKIVPLSTNAQESQLIEQKKFSIIEVSNLTGIPPHKLGDGSRTAYNSLEQENQSFLDDSLDWRLVDWELELTDKVLTEKQKQDDSHEIAFDREQLVRADLAALGNFLSKAVGGPLMTVDEGRMRLGMNQRPGKEGDVLYGPTGQGVPTHEQPPPEDDDPKDTPEPPVRKPSTAAHRALLLRSCQKMAKRISVHLQKLGKKKEFIGPVAFADDHRGVMVEEFATTLNACRPLEETAEHLSDVILKLAADEFTEMMKIQSPSGRDGAIAEWSTRFTGPAMEKLVNNLFEDKAQ